MADYDSLFDEMDADECSHCYCFDGGDCGLPNGCEGVCCDCRMVNEDI